VNGNSFDKCIAPSQLKILLNSLRAPVPVVKEELDDCLVALAEGDSESEEIRIHPVIFESWYRKYFSEYEEDDIRS